MFRAHPAPTPATILDKARALLKAGRHTAALDVLRAAVLADPASPVLRYHLGRMQGHVGLDKDAEASLRLALAASPSDPGIRSALGITLLMQGRFKEGWPLYEARHELPSGMAPKPDAFAYPRWGGEGLAGKRLVIFPEQGFGDQIQFSRYVPALTGLGANVILLCRPELQTIFAASFPGATVLAAQGDVNLPDPDYWIMAGDIPRHVEVSPRKGAAYLVAAPVHPVARPTGRIGVATSGNPFHSNDQMRSLSQDDAAYLISRLKGEVVSLDPRSSGAQTFADTAAIIGSLDALVTVDTSVAHLAGALGATTHLLLPAVGQDWRWMRERPDTPLYPSMTLYRQALGEGWRGAIDRMLPHAATSLA